MPEVKKFESFMPEYESMLVPLGMIFSFVEMKKVLRNVLGWESDSARVLIIAGGNDTLVGVTLMQKNDDAVPEVPVEARAAQRDDCGS